MCCTGKIRDIIDINVVSILHRYNITSKRKSQNKYIIFKEIITIEILINDFAYIPLHIALHFDPPKLIVVMRHCFTSPLSLFQTLLWCCRKRLCISCSLVLLCSPKIWNPNMFIICGKRKGLRFVYNMWLLRPL